jgi:hypothetical protein
MKVASGGRARYLHLVKADPALTERIDMNIGLADRKRNKPGHQQRLKDHEPVTAADCVDVDSLPQRMPGAWRAAYLPVMLFAAIATINAEWDASKLPRHIQLVDEAIVHITRPAARARQLVSCEVFALRFHLLAP